MWDTTTVVTTALAEARKIHFRMQNLKTNSYATCECYRERGGSSLSGCSVRDLATVHRFQNIPSTSRRHKAPEVYRACKMTLSFGCSSVSFGFLQFFCLLLQMKRTQKAFSVGKEAQKCCWPISKNTFFFSWR